MKPVLVYTILLIASLGLAYQTWTRGDMVLPSGLVTLWSVDMDEISSIVYEATDRRVAIERREDENPYLWGSVTRSVVGNNISAASDTTTEFLVGQGADGLLAMLAAPRTLRDLGMLDAVREEEYGLDGSLESIVVQTDRETYEIILGATVFRTNDRYVRDAASGHAYVLQGAALGSLVSAELVYSETRLHTFTLDAVSAVTVRTERGERTMRKSSIGSSGSPSWTPADTPGRPDQTFANFMERLEQLWVGRYEPSIDREVLREVARIDYVDAAGNSIGHAEWLVSENGGEPVYYLVTEHTRVPITLVSGAAERLNQDLAQLL